MKKVFLFGGVALAGYGLYRYFKNQVNLALNYDYKLKNVRVVSATNSSVDITATFSFTNKSSFKVEVDSYNLQLFYKTSQFATTLSNQKFTIQPNGTLDIVGTGTINLDELKIAVLPFVTDVLNRKPIDILVSGEVKVVFLGIPTALQFDKQNFNYSVDILQEYGLSNGYENLKAKYPKLFAMLGIK